jgi:cell division protein FtsB
MMAHEAFESIAALDAIGAATPEEEAELRTHLPGCDECRRARDEYAEAATLMAESIDPVTPPQDLRERVTNAVVVEDDDVDAVVDDDVIEAQRRFRPTPWLATAATLFLALWGWRELAIRAAREHARSKDAEIVQLQEENAQLRAQRQKLTAEMEALASKGTRTIALAGQQVSPSASARVFLEPQNRRAVVFFYDLPANASDKSYQLWIIRSDQPNPQSAGVFDVTTNGRATVSLDNLPLDTQIKALAVTLEPRGGGAQPTNATYYVLGNT